MDAEVDTGALAILRGLTSAYARTPVRSVAVVANAPLPPSADRAAAIDGCDLVVRVNGFALDTDVACVGHRADVVTFTRGVRATPWLFRDYRDRLYLLAEPGRMHWEPETVPDWWPPDLGMVPVPNHDVVLPLSDALGIDSLTHAQWATTGTLAAWLARALYPDADLVLAGYSFIDNPRQTSWSHAYGEDCAISAEHLLEREAALLASWIADSTATLLR